MEHTYNIEEQELKMVMPQCEILLFPEFITWDQCVLLQPSKNESLPNSFQQIAHIQDRTVFESTNNHLHLSNFFNNFEEAPYTCLRLAIKLTHAWATALSRQFPHTRFFVILSFDVSDCVLRFHSIHDGEATWLDLDSLETF